MTLGLWILAIIYGYCMLFLHVAEKQVDANQTRRCKEVHKRFNLPYGAASYKEYIAKWDALTPEERAQLNAEVK